jgi:signal transduction histidine kinase
MNVTKGGIPGLPEIDWGSYFCHFYDAKDDLAGAAVPYIKTGLDNNEASLWLTAEPLIAADARAALSVVVPDLDRRERSGQIEIIDQAPWQQRIGQTGEIEAWIGRQKLASQQGFSGLRLCSNVGRHSSSDAPIDGRFSEHRIIGLFSYSAAHCSSRDVLDVACRYQFTWARYGEDAGATGVEAAARAELAWLQRRFGTEWRTEGRLREADRRKNEFLAMLGHELRNPLASILTASQLMMLRGGEQQFHKELEIIQRQVSHITSMVDDLLDVSRIIAGRVQLNCTSLEIAEAINRGIEIAAPLVGNRSHRLHVHCPPQGLTVNGDPTRLAQVVANLLTNAARYTDPGGDITVRAERSDDDVAVIVRDTGRGIDPQRLTLIFQPFVQGRDGRQRGEGGLGLGLSIVRSLVTLHGGSIEAASTVGKGSEFVVRLPALRHSQSSEATS